MNDRLRHQTLALASAMHCCWLVRQLARKGSIGNEPLECALRPVYNLNPASVDEVYEDGACRELALTVLRTQLGGDSNMRDLEVTRYTATLMHLERKLSSQRSLMQKLRDEIEGAHAQLEYFGLAHDNTVARLADVYANTISTLKPRVMVQGEAGFLNDPGTANRVRALLLAGMRSIVLWRQCGGSRLRLLFQRNRLLQAAIEMLRA